MKKKKSIFIVNKKYFQDENDLFLYAQEMMEENGVCRYQWRLYRFDFGGWHCFAEDAYWRADQKKSEEYGMEALKENTGDALQSINYDEDNLMIAGNYEDKIALKEQIIDLLRVNFPEITFKFV